LFYYYKTKADMGIEISRNFYAAWINAADDCFSELTITSLMRVALQSILFYEYFDHHHLFARCFYEIAVKNAEEYYVAVLEKLADYVDRILPRAYTLDNFKRRQDANMMMICSASLVNMILTGQATVLEAAQYSTSLCGHFWETEFHKAEVEKTIQSMYQTELIEEALENLESRFPLPTDS
jgi:hypothetical protein